MSEVRTEIGLSAQERKWWRRRPWFVLALVLLVAAVPCVSVVREAGYALFPARSRVTQAQAAEARRLLPGLEDVSFRTKDGLLLRGWFAPGSRRDAIVFVHGLWNNRAAFLAEAGTVARHGHGVLLYDSRASGDSEGHLATFGDRERLDIKGALDFLGRRADVDPGRVGLFGCSVGGSAVALVGAEDPRVRAVLLGPTWPSLEAELRTNVKGTRAWAMLALYRVAGVDVDAVRPIDVVRSIAPRPLLMISGSEDGDTPPSVMQALQAAAPGAERWVVPGAGHCRYIDASPVEYVRRFDDFFDKALSGS